jgi:hypothetical protein
MEVSKEFVQNCKKTPTLSEYATVNEKLEALTGTCFRQYIQSKHSLIQDTNICSGKCLHVYICNMEIYVGTHLKFHTNLPTVLQTWKDCVS